MSVSMSHFKGQKSELCERYLKLLDVYDEGWNKIVAASKVLREEKVITDEKRYQEALDHYSAVMNEYHNMRKELAGLAKEMGEK